MCLGKHIKTCIHLYSLRVNCLIALKTSVLWLFTSPSPQILATIDVFATFMLLPFPEGQTVGITQYLDFSGWLLLLNNIHLGSVHVFRGLTTHSFSVLKYFMTWIYLSLVIHSTTEGHCGCFHMLIVMNKDTISIPRLHVGISCLLLWVNPRGCNCWSCGKNVLTFGRTREAYAVLNSHQQWMNSYHPIQVAFLHLLNLRV